MERPYKSKPEDSGYFWLQLPAASSANCQAVSTFRFLKLSLISSFFLFWSPQQCTRNVTQRNKWSEKRRKLHDFIRLPGNFHAVSTVHGESQMCRENISNNEKYGFLSSATGISFKTNGFINALQKWFEVIEHLLLVSLTQLSSHPALIKKSTVLQQLRKAHIQGNGVA